MANITMKNFAICCSLFLVVMFIVCCYLMTIVNPAPLPDNESSSNKPKAESEAGPPPKPPERNPRRMQFKHDLDFSLSGAKSEKASTKSSSEMELTKHYTNGSETKDTDNLPTLSLAEYSKLIAKLKANTTNVHRRSVNEIQEKYDEQGNIVVKIVDRIGSAIVEIKLAKNEPNTDSRYNIYIKTNKDNTSFEAKDALIKIILKDTLGNDENNGSIILTSDKVFEYERTDQTYNVSNSFSISTASYSSTKSITNDVQNENEMQTTSKHLSLIGEEDKSDEILVSKKINRTVQDTINVVKDLKDITSTDSNSRNNYVINTLKNVKRDSESYTIDDMVGDNSSIEETTRKPEKATIDFIKTYNLTLEKEHNMNEIIKKHESRKKYTEIVEGESPSTTTTNTNEKIKEDESRKKYTEIVEGDSTESPAPKYEHWSYTAQ